MEKTKRNNFFYKKNTIYVFFVVVVVYNLNSLLIFLKAVNSHLLIVEITRSFNTRTQKNKNRSVDLVFQTKKTILSRKNKNKNI